MGWDINVVERSLENLHFVSLGISPGCAECMDAYGYGYDEDENGWFAFIDRASNPVSEHFKTEDEAIEARNARFEDDVSSGKVFAEPHFSHYPCGICNTSLGGDREEWHAVNADGELLHFDDCCTDCAMYIANGEQPVQD